MLKVQKLNMHRLPDLLTLLRLQQLQEEGSTLKRQPTVGTILKLSFFFFQLFISGWDGVGEWLGGLHDFSVSLGTDWVDWVGAGSRGFGD